MFERISYVHRSSHIFFWIPESSALQIPSLYYCKMNVLITLSIFATLREAKMLEVGVVFARNG